MANMITFFRMAGSILLLFPALDIPKGLLIWTCLIAVIKIVNRRAISLELKPFVIGALQRKIKAMFAMLEHHKPTKDKNFYRWSVVLLKKFL